MIYLFVLVALGVLAAILYGYKLLKKDDWSIFLTSAVVTLSLLYFIKSYQRADSLERLSREHQLALQRSIELDSLMKRADSVNRVVDNILAVSKEREERLIFNKTNKSYPQTASVKERIDYDAFDRLVDTTKDGMPIHNSGWTDGAIISSDDQGLNGSREGDTHIYMDKAMKNQKALERKLKILETALESSQEKQALSEQADSIYKRITNSPNGLIGYNVIDTMEVDKTYEFRANVMKGIDTTLVIANLPISTSMKREVKRIPVTCRVTVTLIDPDKTKFDIVPIGSEEQYLGEDSPTEWEWRVTPKEEGANELKMLTIVHIPDRFGVAPLNKKVFEKKFIVHTTFTKQVARFMTTNWVTLLSVFGLALVLWFGRNSRALFRRLFKKEKIVTGFTFLNKK